MPGPLPNAARRRRNTATIHTTNLPAAGRTARAPRVPATYTLGKPGRSWWRWAWSLPQATKWDDGTLYAAARRAQLEDELAALDFTDRLDLEDLLAGANPEAIKRAEWAISTLKRSASGSVSLMKEMRELDKRLGLDPKALAELRWTILDEDEAPAQTSAAAAPANVRQLRAVDAA